MKMYILVRTNMSPAWQRVQACHAVAQYLMNHPLDSIDQKEVWDNGTMVILSVEDQNKLMEWHEKIKQAGFAVEVYEEGYLTGYEKFTALAAIGDQKLSNLLVDLKLL